MLDNTRLYFVLMLKCIFWNGMDNNQNMIDLAAKQLIYSNISDTALDEILAHINNQHLPNLTDIVITTNNIAIDKIGANDKFDTKYIFSIKAPLLRNLSISCNKKIYALDMRHSNEIETLDLSYANIARISLPACTQNLKEIELSSSALEELYLYNSSNLRILRARDSKLKKLCIINCLALKELDLAITMSLQELIITTSHNLTPALSTLDLEASSIQKLNLAACKNLKNINFAYSNIKNIYGLENCLLKLLNLNYTQLKSFPILNISNKSLEIMLDNAELSELNNLMLLHLHNTHLFTNINHNKKITENILNHDMITTLLKTHFSDEIKYLNILFKKPAAELTPLEIKNSLLISYMCKAELEHMQTVLNNPFYTEKICSLKETIGKIVFLIQQKQYEEEFWFHKTQIQREGIYLYFRDLEYDDIKYLDEIVFHEAYQEEIVDFMKKISGKPLMLSTIDLRNFRSESSDHYSINNIDGTCHYDNSNQQTIYLNCPQLNTFKIDSCENLMFDFTACRCLKRIVVGNREIYIRANNHIELPPQTNQKPKLKRNLSI